MYLPLLHVSLLSTPPPFFFCLLRERVKVLRLRVMTFYRERAHAKVHLRG
jgi:hypothetical protein